jgi:hypothetical protein
MSHKANESVTDCSARFGFIVSCVTSGIGGFEIGN